MAKSRIMNYENQVAYMDKEYKALMAAYQEEDKTISRLQTALEQSIEKASKYTAFVDGDNEEILHYKNKCKCLEEEKDQEIQRLVQSLKKKDELLDQMQHEQHSLKEKVKELSNELTKQDLVYRNTVSMLETERAAATHITAENQALSSKLLRLETQMCDDRDKMSLRADLLEKENHISYLQSEMFQGNSRIARLQKEVQTLAEAVWEHRTKRVDAEEERDRALGALWSKEQTVAQLKTWQVGLQQFLRKYWETSQLLQDKDKMIQELQLNLARMEYVQEECLDTWLKEIRSQTESYGRPFHFLNTLLRDSSFTVADVGNAVQPFLTEQGKLDRGTRQRGTACGPDPAHPREDNKRDTTGRCTDSSVSSTESQKNNSFPKPGSPTAPTSAGHSQGVNVRKAESDRSINKAQKRKFTEGEVCSSRRALDRTCLKKDFVRPST
ncbi:uncharacterized protein LOC143484950 [Brachyhypopomus gauderio]|uniref:uncharacterized protein LOC143484950 n=1 Tax=Brachyhypopomus gauderio TaxID=698409 RepID=UPI00404222CD